MFFQLSPGALKSQPRAKARKAPDMQEEIYEVVLAPFTANPKVMFENVAVGTVATRRLKIRNSSSEMMEVSVRSNVPDEVQFGVSWKRQCIEALGECELVLSWCPPSVDAFRHTITIEDGRRLHKDVSVVFKSFSNKKPGKTSVSKPTCRSSLVRKPPKTSPKRKHTKFVLTAPKTHQTFCINDKENIPNNNTTFDFKSPSNINFLVPPSKSNVRETYVVNDIKPLQFNDSLNKEAISPISGDFAAKLQNFSWNLSPSTPKNDFLPSDCSTASKENNSSLSLSGFLRSKLDGGVKNSTFVQNTTSATYVKDSSLGIEDFHNLATSPISSKQHRQNNLSSDGIRNVIEADLWTPQAVKPLARISEEKSSVELGVKRKSSSTFRVSPPKKPMMNRHEKPLDWKKFSEPSVKLIGESPYLLQNSNIDPFLSVALYGNEDWLEKQIIDFKKWLNALLAPPLELQSNVQQQSVDVAKVWAACKGAEPAIAPPNKETICNQYHEKQHKLNSLRKAARALYQEPETCKVLLKVISAVDTDRLSMRSDKDLHLNLALKTQLLKLVLSYNPLWLRIGLETIYNCTIELASNSDILGLSGFLKERLFKDPLLVKKYKSIYSPKYIVELKKFFLKKFFILVYFLDLAKTRKLIGHDPCLFCCHSEVKESREMLLVLSRETLAAMGDITKYLKLIGYVVRHKQTYIHEFDYAVNNLGCDLRDGVRLVRLMEIILLKSGLVELLRVPAISRLQKIHNVKLVFDALSKADFQIQFGIEPKDLVDGHKEKTLSFLWQIIYKFQAPLMVQSATKIQIWWRSQAILLKRQQLSEARLIKENAAKYIIKWYKQIKLSRKLEVFQQVYRIHSATLKIQRWYRSCKLGQINQKVSNSVVKLQALIRGFLLRKNLQVRNKAIIKLQATWRRVLAQKNYKKIQDATIKIQQRYKTYVIRKHFLKLKSSTLTIQRRLRAQKMMLTQRANYKLILRKIILVQAKWRAVMATNYFNKIMAAVITIQRSFKAWKTRTEFIKLKAASVVIQRRFRAYKLMIEARDDYKVVREKIILVQAKWRGILARNHYNKTRNVVIKIQQSFRAYKIRQEFLELKLASVTIQRRYRARLLMLRQQEHYKLVRQRIILIQAKWRGALAEKNYKKTRKAVIKIQESYKAFKTRKQFLELKSSTITIQQRFRAQKFMLRQRSHYEIIRRSIVLIQAKWRGFLAKRSYNKIRNGAIKIQQTFKAYKTRKQFVQLKSASVVIQRRFRAQKMMLKDQAHYKLVCEKTILIQAKWRGVLARNSYNKTRNAAITIQQSYKAYKTRKQFVELKSASVTIQRRFRAKKLMLRQQEHYKLVRHKIILIQANWRGFLARNYYNKTRKAVIKIQQSYKAYKTRKQFVELKLASVTIQQRFRAQKLMLKQRNHYELIRKSIILIQARWRGVLARNNYNKIRNAVIKIQQTFKAYKTRKQFVELKSASVVIQRRFRAQKMMLKQRKHYELVRQRIVVIQALWRGVLARNHYKKVRNAVIKIQQSYKAYKTRKQFVELKLASVTIQQRFRAKKLMLKQRNHYELTRKSIILIQAKWRGVLARNNYNKIRNAAIKIQQTFKAYKTRKQFVELKSASVVIQRRFRAQKLMLKQRKHYELVRQRIVVIQALWRGVLARSNYKRIINAVIKIQRRYKTYKSRKQYLKIKSAALTIQQRFRAQNLMLSEHAQYQITRKTIILLQIKWRAKQLMLKERSAFLKLKASVLLIESKYISCKLSMQQRLEFLKLKKSAIQMQRYSRGFLLRKKYASFFSEEAKKERKVLRIKAKASVKIQAAWRGYLVRSRNTPQLVEIRKKAGQANNNASENPSLAARSEQAMQLLAHTNSLVQIAKALDDIEFTTRRSPALCVKTARFLPKQLYIMLVSTNRSLPEMNICTFIVKILINYCKYPLTKPYSFVPESMDNVFTLMLHWCDKEAPLFPALCTLIWLFAQEQDWRTFILTLPNIKQKLLKIEGMCLRKASMVARTKQKSFYFAPCNKLFLPTLLPDWGLDYEHKPNLFQQSVHAVQNMIGLLNS